MKRRDETRPIPVRESMALSRGASTRCRRSRCCGATGTAGTTRRPPVPRAAAPARDPDPALDRLAYGEAHSRGATGGAGLRRGRRHQRGRLPRGAQLRRGVPGVRGVLVQTTVRHRAYSARPAGTAAPSLVVQGIGYGGTREQVDGNDPLAVTPLCSLVAVEHARTGQGPFLIEAHTYRDDRRTRTPTTPPLPGRGRGERVDRSRSGRPTRGVPARAWANRRTPRSTRSPRSRSGGRRSA